MPFPAVSMLLPCCTPAVLLMMTMVHAMLMTFFFIMPAVISGLGTLLDYQHVRHAASVQHQYASAAVQQGERPLTGRVMRQHTLYIYTTRGTRALQAQACARQGGRPGTHACQMRATRAVYIRARVRVVHIYARRAMRARYIYVRAGRGTCPPCGGLRPAARAAARACACVYTRCVARAGEGTRRV